MARKNVTDKMVCEAYAEMDALREQNLDYKFPYETLAEKTGECEKVCYAAIERAESRGYIEYGVSLRTGWLTDKGKKLLST
ncbi:MAG: hypothetical protein A2V66_16810 [Ignavibacteria bacterium RBG_13_36_8]|nr:MAG: hypothetical protein A2V66_16810 [Ignavibacteria bacterium RBG_13_36_8]